jgi:hypothetical protein
MKILYLGSFGKPYDTEKYIADSLEFLGHTVERLHVSEYTETQIGQIADSIKPDFILLSKGWPKGEGMGYAPFMKTLPYPKVSWFFDLVWPLPSCRKALIYNHPIFSADITFTTDGGSQEEFRKHGINHHVLRQGIYEPEAVRGKPRDEFKYDVVFVGGSRFHGVVGWNHRKELIRFLERAYGNRFKQFGQENENEIRNLELNDLYASAKVVVGDTVYSPQYWSNRLYESLGRGAFLIFPMVDGLEQEFEPYEHFIPYYYGQYAELKDKIEFFLAHPKERKRIQDAGFAYCKAHHTYTKRCEQLIREVKKHLCAAK